MILFLDVHYWDGNLDHKVKAIPFTMYEASILTMVRLRTEDGLYLGEIRLTPPLRPPFDCGDGEPNR